MPNFRSARRIGQPTEKEGLSVASGFWKTIWICATCSGVR